MTELEKMTLVVMLEFEEAGNGTAMAELEATNPMFAAMLVIEGTET